VSAFASLMRRADMLRRVEPDPARAEWYAGYMRGLRRAHHGERFGSEAEHTLWLSASESTDPMRAALGRGYRAGLTLESREETRPSAKQDSTQVIYIIPQQNERQQNF